MAQTYADIITAALGNDFDPVTQSVTVRQAITDGVAELNRLCVLPGNQTTSTITTVVGTQAYSIPALNTRIIELYDPSTGVTLQAVDITVLDDFLTSQVGVPSSYALYGQSIYLWPVPNVVRSLTLRYVGVGQPVADTDVMATVTSIPEEYLHALVEFARHRLFRMEDDMQMSQFWRGEFDRTAHFLRGDLQRRDRSRVKRTPGMFAGAPYPTRPSIP